MAHQTSSSLEPSTPLERELKFALEPAGVARLRAHRLLGDMMPDTKSYVSTYFDTADHALSKAKMSLRLRKFDDRIVQTLKEKPAHSSGFFARAEYETEVAGPEPDIGLLRLHCSSAALDLLQSPLAPVFDVEVQRTEWLIDWKGRALSLVLDEGWIIAGTRREQIRETEIELRHGRMEDAFDFARQLAFALPLRFEVMSKAERGYRLCRNEDGQAQKAEAIKLQRKSTAAIGFQIVASLCLRHFTANESVFLVASKPEALHQMRVAIRRLRSLFSFFDGMGTKPEMAEFQVTIRRLFKKLGAARDLDVLLDTLKEVEDSRIAAAVADIQKERDAACEQLRAMLRSQLFCLTMIDLFAFVECRTSQLRGGGEKLAAKASSILTAQQKKMRKYGAVTRLRSEKRHKLRIEAKKFRYASEFFEGLFQSSKAKRRRETLARNAEALQETLGTLNDRVFMDNKLSPWLGPRRRRNLVKKKLGGESHQDLIEAAKAAQKTLLREKRFWD